MCETIATKEYPFVMCNFAPPDMVGHTGKYEPCIIACEATGIKLSSMNTELSPISTNLYLKYPSIKHLYF